MERGTAETMGAGGDLLHGKEDKHEGGDLLLPRATYPRASGAGPGSAVRSPTAEASPTP